MGRATGRLAKGLGLVTGIAVVTAGAVAAGVELERRVIGKRLTKTPIQGAENFFELQSAGQIVLADDGVRLHVEVDPAPGPDPGATIVLVHGYALSMHCWHYQRKHLRGRRKLVLFDQRSHGRSDLSRPGNCRIPQLASDLNQVLTETTAEDEPVILVGHSMGGMAIQEFCRRYPHLIGSKVAGVALIASSAGELGRHSIIRGISDEVFPKIVPPLLAVGSRIQRTVDTTRVGRTAVGHVVARRFGYGPDASPDQVDFLAAMLAVMPLQVVADFYPAFADFDGLGALALMTELEALIIGGASDVIVPPDHSERIIEALPHADGVILPRSGHMGIIEHHALVNARLDRLIARAEARLRRRGHAPTG